ncbi:MAG: FAD-binding oxidoreductase [Anaerolineales bacterium]|nr:FAD-binding oxidoreductase [Anaerolineales bacterium]
MSALPKHIRYLVIGAGIHGLSTAWHLGKELRARGEGSGEDVLVVDKEGPGAGASGIACGVVRNFYFQPAMGAVMRASVEVWEEYSDRLHYHPVGYLAVAGPVQAADLEVIYERQQNSGYRSHLVTGEEDVFDYMRGLFPDWKARGLTACLHEKQGGFAFNTPSVMGLLSLAEAEGVRMMSSTEVKGFKTRGDAVTTVHTNRGDIEVDQVVVAVGPWIKQVWSMLDLPERIDIHTPDGDVVRDRPMWTFWRLQEGEIRLDPEEYVTADGEYPPVLHIDSSEPLVSDRTGDLITDDLWGIYFKRDKRGVQGGAVPEEVGPDAQVDPYPFSEDSREYVVGDDFVDYWTSGLAHCMERFEGSYVAYHRAPSGGIGAFSADSFPVFDWMLDNVYVVADSNHGYKMVGVGKEVARVLMGEESGVLRPFRFDRFETGDLHPVSNSPYPWS